MAPPTLRRRLVAILAADAVQYSRLMAADERATVMALDAARGVFRAFTAEHAGTVIDTAGDSILALFETAAGAVEAALSIQRRLVADAASVAEDRRMLFRIGIHLGDVFVKEDNTVYGDGVNIASRLQALADPAGIVVSQSIRTAIEGHVDASFVDLGKQSVKNIQQPVGVFSIVDPAGRPPTLPPRSKSPFRRAAIGAAILLAAIVAGAGWWAIRSERTTPSADANGSVTRSIAVLPFANLGEDKDSAYFAAGISEELLNTLGLVPRLKVIARTSASRFANGDVALPEIGRQLGVAYLVEGSVRVVAGQVRITARLARAADGNTLWAESFTRSSNDALSVQSEIALIVAQKLQLQVTRADLDASNASNAKAQRLQFESVQAIFEHKPESYDRAEALLNQALVLDPHYGLAQATLANVWWNRLHDARKLTFKYKDSPDLARIFALLDEALKNAPGSAETYVQLAATQFNAWQLTESERSLDRAIALNPNFSSIYLYRGIQMFAAGRMDEALHAFRQLVDLDPLAPRRFASCIDALLSAGRPAEAMPYIERALVLEPANARMLMFKARALAYLDRGPEAMEIVRKVSAIGPRVERVAIVDVESKAGGVKEREDIEAYLSGLAAQPRGGPNPRLAQVYPLLALHRPAEALQMIEDETDFSPDEIASLFYFHSAWDPVRATDRFKAILAHLGLTDAHARAQAWRAANPPQAKYAP
jgi:adenylate cyclase